jgi:hypothetical protein
VLFLVTFFGFLAFWAFSSANVFDATYGWIYVVFLLLLPCGAAVLVRRMLKKEAKSCHKLTTNEGVSFSSFSKMARDSNKRSYTLKFASAEYAAAFISVNGGDLLCKYDHAWLQQSLALTNAKGTGS